MGRAMAGGASTGPAADVGPTPQGTRPASTTVARIDPQKCTGCGLCIEACPLEAIRLEGQTAVVDPERCTGCGICVDECPNGAAALTSAA